MNNSAFKLFLRMLLGPYKFVSAAAVVSVVVFAALGLVMPWMLKIIIDRVLGTGDVGLLWVIIGAIAGIYLAREIFMYISHFLIYYLSQKVMFDVRRILFKHLQSLSLRFYEEYRTGKLISNIITDVQRLEQMTVNVMNVLSVNSFSIVFITIVLFLINPKLAMIAFVLMPLQFVNFLYFKQALNRDNLILSEKMSMLSANLAETISGIRIVKSFAQERAENRYFVAQLRPVMSSAMNFLVNTIYCWVFSDFISGLCTIITIGAGGTMVIRGSMSIGDFVAFYSYLGMLVNPIVQLSGLSSCFSNGMTGAERIAKLLDTVPEIKDCENPVILDDIKGQIDFNKVSFAYGDEKMVVKQFSLEIKPGQKVAFVGPSGSGKTTIASLLLRFYDVSGGSINVDGHDIRSLKLDDYRSRIGVVMQEPFLFSGSIEDNISYGKKDASPDEIRNAARMANVEEFVRGLEKGYKSELGENGTSLSGGQKQRVAIARAILKNPRILILDEATSALDTVSEYLVQDALDNLMRNRTTIIIAHRLSTVKNADMIVVMKDGQIRQLGNHATLIAQEGVYRELYIAQEEKATGKRPQVLIS